MSPQAYNDQNGIHGGHVVLERGSSLKPGVGVTPQPYRGQYAQDRDPSPA
jgi:hypothetical protein